MYEFYNRHFLKTREDGCITDAFSDGPLYGHSTDGYICFNERAGYQLRLIIDGVETEENPPLWTMEGVPLYKWVDGKISRRSEEEIQAEVDALPPPPPSAMEQMSSQMDAIMLALCDVYEAQIGEV